MEDYRKIAIELGQTLINKAPETREDVERMLPELKESEDEKIRKALIRYFTLSDEHAYNEACGVSYRDIVAWLEKQGEKIENANKEYWRGYREGKQEVLDKYTELKKQGEDNPAEWSEEDESNFQNIDSVLFYDKNLPEDTCMRLRNWLQSLRPHNRWKPSDEQMKILNEVLNFAANHESPHWNDYIFGTLNNLIRQLKKRKE